MPEWATPVSIDDIKRLISECRRLMPDVGIQVPPNLSDWWAELVEAGATDLGGLSANGDHISPEHAFPSPHEVRKGLAPKGYALTERLCVYPQYMDPEWMEQGVLDVIKLKYWSFIPRRGSGRRREESLEAGLAEQAIAKGPRGRGAERGRADGAVRRDAAGGRSRRCGLPPMSCGRSWRGIGRRSSSTGTSTSPISAWSAARSAGLGRGKRSPDAYEVSEEDFAERVRDAVEFGATEICMQGGIHPDLTLEEYGKWLRLAKEVAPQLHLHAYSPMEVHYMCERSGKGPDEVFEYLMECGLGSTPGTAAEVLDDGVRQRISPNKLPAQRWVEIIEASHRAGLRSTSTVMFGHIEEPRELARHMRVDPGAAGADRRHHRVRPAQLHPLQHDARAHPRDRGDLRRGEPQAHRRLPAGAGQDDPQPAGELGEDGPRRRHRVAALGGQRPRRHADGGEHLADGGLPARGAAGARAADRGRPRRRAASPPSARPSTRSSRPTTPSLPPRSRVRPPSGRGLRGGGGAGPRRRGRRLR